MINQIISHYKILEKLGKGGMGIIYKAEDLKLKRNIALKVLSESSILNEELKKRFIIEAQAASSLQHNNICTIHEIDEMENGQLFISMDYYEGKTLKDIISDGRLDHNEVIRISTQIAEGLSKAHQNNIIHRDIKPANILVTNDGVVKILDFGLAKVRGQTRITQLGFTAGTVEYMSPEQARGENIDERTDIWSLGVVIYEMLTGESPFKGDYEQAQIYSILHSEPDFNKIPRDIRYILKKALAKALNQRYQNLKEFLIDLKLLKENSKVKRYLLLLNPRRIGFKIKLLTGVLLLIALSTTLYFNANNKIENQVPEKARKMIVVLPFRNLGPPEDEYLAQGMREEISNRLAAFSNLGVISRNSAEICSQAKMSTKQIAMELGVDFILEGTVQWINENSETRYVRIYPQLIQVSEDVNVWSDTYDRKAEDIFDVQNEIAQNVVDRIGVNVISEKIKGPPPTRNLEAYDYYIKALPFQYNVSSNSDLYTCISLYKKSVELDPGFAGAHAHLCIAYMALYQFFADRDTANLQKASEHLRISAELNPNLAEVHMANAFYYEWVKKDYKLSQKEFKKTIEIQPSNAEAHYWAGGIEGLLKASSLDPLVARYKWLLGNYYNGIGEYQKSESYYKRAIELNSSTYSYYVPLARNYIDWKGNTKLAWEAVKKIRDDSYLEDYSNIFVYLNILDRNYDQALNELKTSKKEYEDNWQNFIPNSQMIALVYKYKNDERLSRAYFDSSRIELERMLKNNQDDSRFHAALSTAYAGLGNEQKALSEAKKAVELMQSHTEDKYLHARFLSKIYLLLGINDNAIKQIKILLSKPSELSINFLILDPFYDNLRAHPDYKGMIEKYAGINSGI